MTRPKSVMAARRGPPARKGGHCLHTLLLLVLVLLACPCPTLVRAGAGDAAARPGSARAVEQQYLQGLERGKAEYEGGFDEEWHHPAPFRHSEGGLATAAECASLVHAFPLLAKTGRQCIATHSVYGNESPYTMREYVESVRAVQAVRALIASPDGPLAEPVRLFLELSERVRARVAAKRNATEGELFFHLTELVCRRPRHFETPEHCTRECQPVCMDGCPEDCLEHTPGANADECTASCARDCQADCTATCTDPDWLSHPVHADANEDDCDMLDDGVCMRRLPEDITSHLYFNEDFEGGNFFFTHGGREGSGGRSIIQPTCGRTLFYTSGYENEHGVTGVRSGERCLMTMWFTRDPRKVEELPLPAGSPALRGRRAGPGRGLGQPGPRHSDEL